MAFRAWFSVVTILIGISGFLSPPTIVCFDPVDQEWQKSTLVYQIQLEAFQDSDGDGEGGLKGIINRLDDLKGLGIDAISLSPIYSSPLTDAGYDISNYTDVNRLYGTLEHFDELVEQAHARDLKIILDMVLNHSSDEHEWFLLSTENIPPYNDYYVWSNGTTDEAGNDIAPNNWVSTRGTGNEGSAWTWHDGRQQWYYHKFRPSQPDLNLRNEHVLEEILNVFDFWLKRDADGFRINAASYLIEDKDLRDEPTVGNGSRTTGLPESAALLYTFRAYIDDWIERNNSTTKLLIAESNDFDSDTLMSYDGNGTRKGIPSTNFLLANRVFNNSDIKGILEECSEKVPKEASTTWASDSQLPNRTDDDDSRAASKLGLNRVDGLDVPGPLLPGQTPAYYDKETAMPHTDVQWNDTTDSTNNYITPMETYGNFSTDPNGQERVGENQSDVDTLKLLAALRKNEVFNHGNYEFATVNDNHVLVLKRFLDKHPTYLTLVNLGLRTENVNLASLYPNVQDTLRVVVSSDSNYIDKNVSRENVTLAANAVLVLKAELPTLVETTTTSVTNSANRTRQEPTATTEEEISVKSEPDDVPTTTEVTSGSTGARDTLTYQPIVLVVIIMTALCGYRSVFL